MAIVCVTRERIAALVPRGRQVDSRTSFERLGVRDGDAVSVDGARGTGSPPFGGKLMKLVLFVFALAMFAQGCSSSSADASGKAPNCTFDAATFNVNGASGQALQDIQGEPCSFSDSCTEAVAGTPFCGREASHLDDYSCTCQDGKVACVLVTPGGGIAARGWCDGGNGTNDAGR
jgi:hypothetical protein